MTDLAKLASEITPGPWEVVGYEYVDQQTLKSPTVQSGGEVIVWWSASRSDERRANVTAMALTPELIAEVLRLREEKEKLVESMQTICREYCQWYDKGISQDAGQVAYDLCTRARIAIAAVEESAQS